MKKTAEKDTITIKNTYQNTDEKVIEVIINQKISKLIANNE